MPHVTLKDLLDPGIDIAALEYELDALGLQGRAPRR